MRFFSLNLSFLLNGRQARPHLYILPAHVFAAPLAPPVPSSFRRTSGMTFSPWRAKCVSVR
ncbi:hypothetical protein WOLCODRAFT_151863 [Wolfiporia cocos MD-104 SS10]|uniref:Uncharacterized protein n=1 Tax=Wolfiporia cocos (strain MD-104) TaxID=742152 RepID=A0A2H3JI03_WOLCO|nr:hypothetical protein WOLCODRAFT_151863 [Wolfiporia cocos MD-104 SS10]